MAKRIAVAFMGILLVSSVILLVNAYRSISDLELSLSETSTALEQTQTELQNAKGTLAQTQANLEKTTSELIQTRNELTQKMAELTRKESQFNTERAALVKTAEDNKFYFYYTKPSQRYGVTNLALSLAGRQWTRAYSENVFDCSEMSASLERYLENEGFHTIIVIGNSPDGSNKGHAWLLVEAERGTYMPVEATQMAVVYWNSPYFNNYFKYERQFETIQQALSYNAADFDWWAS